jgi:hypothetical protein
MDSTIKKRSIVIGGHETSISLEDNFWTSLRQIAVSAQQRCRKSSACSMRRATAVISHPPSACSFSTIIATMSQHGAAELRSPRLRHIR